MSKRRKGDPGAEVSLPITPMLDMTFQLLMYFIATYHPSALEGEMDLALANSNVTQSHDKPSEISAAPSKDLPKDDKDELNVRVQMKGDNKYVVTLEEKTATIDKPVGTPMENLKELEKTLAVKFKSRAEKIKSKLKETRDSDPKADLDKIRKDEIKKVSINVQGDRGLKMGSVIEVMDSCRMAGNLAFKEAFKDTGMDVSRDKISVNFGAPPEVGK